MKMGTRPTPSNGIHTKRPHFDKEQVLADAERYGFDRVVYHLDPRLAAAWDGNHHACYAKCGGDGTDRFRAFDRGGFICNQCCPDGCGDIFSTVQFMLQCDFPDAVAWVATIVGSLPAKASDPRKPSSTLSQPPQKPIAIPPTSQASYRRTISAELSQRLNLWRKTWNDCVCQHRHAIDYLASRGISILPNTWRYRREHPYFKEKVFIGVWPALIAKVCSPNGKLVTLHSTYLDQDSPAKANLNPNKKLSSCEPGATVGAAIRLFEPGPVLAIAEGIETCLSITEATGTPTWASISAGGMKSIEIPPTVETVELWADRDHHGKGQDAAYSAARRLTGQGFNVRVILPKEGGAA